MPTYFVLPTNYDSLFHLRSNRSLFEFHFHTRFVVPRRRLFLATHQHLSTPASSSTPSLDWMLNPSPLTRNHPHHSRSSYLSDSNQSYTRPSPYSATKIPPPVFESRATPSRSSKPSSPTVYSPRSASTLPSPTKNHPPSTVPFPFPSP